jgi:hypothetical protein
MDEGILGMRIVNIKRCDGEKVRKCEGVKSREAAICELTAKAARGLRPDGRWGDFIRRAGSTILFPAARKTACRDDAHVFVTSHLATKPKAKLPAQTARLENRSLRLRHPRGFTFDEPDPAGCALGVSAAGVELVDVRFVREGQDETLALRYFKSSDTFDVELWHLMSLQQKRSRGNTIGKASPRKRGN